MTTNQNTNIEATPDNLIFQAVQCANNYSDYDVQAMLSALTNHEIVLLNKYLSKISCNLVYSRNDRIVRAIAIIQDFVDVKLF